MPRIKKKGTSGQAKNFITRTQAVRKLQISLPEFRKLCIFKGIYPREPRNKKKASKSSTQSTTFYYTKDIQYLLHEPILQKYRDHKALAKKIGRHLGRNEVPDAARLEKTQKPRVRLDHIIKERYPTFVDALRDLDDALSMIFLFANLPSQAHVDHKKIALCQRLALEFEHYLIISHSLRKSFLSIKGIYYQATIQGQDILWLVPYKFVQRVSKDVDFRIMDTFLEFYTTLLGFVNFRLYSSIGLIYPPKFNIKSDEEGGELDAFQIQSHTLDTQQAQLENGDTNGVGEDPAQLEATTRAQALADSLTNTSKASNSRQASPAPSEAADEADPSTNTTEIDKFPTPATSTDTDILTQPGPSSNEAGTLFTGCVFYLSRETPRQPLEFILKAFGCRRVGWDAVLGAGAFTTDESNPAITHQVVDRPLLAATTTTDAANGEAETTSSAPKQGRYPNRTYIQPQWVWDCINNGVLLPPADYGPGATLPPHLSPFVKAKAGAYDPTAPLEVGDAEVVDATAGAVEGASDDEDEDEDEVEEDEEEDEGLDGESTGFSALDADKAANDDEDDFGGFSSDEEGNKAAAPAGKPVLKSALKNPAQKQKEKKAKEEAEHRERQKMMLSRRKRKLYEKMEYSNARKEEEKEKLVSKRRKIEGKKA